MEVSNSKFIVHGRVELQSMGKVHQPELAPLKTRITSEAFIIFQGWSSTLQAQKLNFGEFLYLSGIY